MYVFLTQKKTNPFSVQPEGALDLNSRINGQNEEFIRTQEIQMKQKEEGEESALVDLSYKGLTVSAQIEMIKE